jgi:hypothetical protein
MQATETRRRLTAGRVVLGVALAMLVTVVTYVAELAIPKRDYFIERRGELIAAESDNVLEQGVVMSAVRLRASSGLEVAMRVVRPEVEPGDKLPVIVMLGGEGTGRNAVDLVGRPDGVVYAALDYPYEGDQELDAFWESIAAIPGIQQAFLDSPPALSLAVDWLEQQDWLDPGRVELVGASLGVPFTAVAGALDTRFSRVWLLHGGARNFPWVMHVGRRYIENEWLRSIVARSALLLVYGASFDTEAWIREISPRELVIVSARDDDFVPPKAQQPFIEASASDHVELLWTEGKHVQPSRKEELGQLLDIVLRRVTGD